MKWLCTLMSVLCLLAGQVQAEEGESIAIFFTQGNPVAVDIELPKHIDLQVYNMDEKDNATRLLNQMVKAKVDRIGLGTDPGQAYSQAFSEVINIPEWTPVYDQMTKGGMAIAKAVSFQVKKLPAVVFNEKQVIYGVTSLKEAITIYAREGD